MTIIGKTLYCYHSENFPLTKSQKVSRMMLLWFISLSEVQCCEKILRRAQVCMVTTLRSLTLRSWENPQPGSTCWRKSKVYNCYLETNARSMIKLRCNSPGLLQKVWYLIAMEKMPTSKGSGADANSSSQNRLKKGMHKASISSLQNLQTSTKILYR